jgi:hypothetical protein
MSKLVRVSDATYSKLDKIAIKTGFSRQEIFDQAIKKLEREAIFKQANEAYTALRNDPDSWKEEQEERELWDATLTDGLEDE